MKICPCCLRCLRWFKAWFKEKENPSDYQISEERKISENNKSVRSIVNISGEPKVDISGDSINKNSDVPSTYQKKPTDARFKVTLIGDARVGKTALLSIFDEGAVPTDYTPTEQDVKTVWHSVNGIVVQFEIWDLSGQERNRSSVPAFLKKREAIIIVYSTKSKESFKNLPNWIDLAREHTETPEQLYLLGNKYGPPEEQEVSKDEVNELAATHHVEHHLIDFHSRDEVRKFFQRLVENSSRPSQVQKCEEIPSRLKPSEKSRKYEFPDDPDDRSYRQCLLI